MAPPTDGTPARERYSRQSRFWAIGEGGQERLGAARVLVVGCGALGSAALDLLARAGVGLLTVVDRDVVELSNLQRQLLFDEADAQAGTPKAVAAARAVHRINSEVEVRPIVADVTPANVEALVAAAGAVLDGTDNLETRYLLNDACVKAGVPWVYGGAIGSTGMSMTVVPGETACFRCVFPDHRPGRALATCDTAGVLGPSVVAVAGFQTAEILKLVVRDREHVNRGLTAFDLWTNELQRVERVQRQPGCPCCAERRFEYLEARSTSQTTSLCGRNAVQVSPGRPVALDLGQLGRRLAVAGAVTSTEHLVRLRVGEHELTVFGDGRAIVKGTSDVAQARSLYARYVGA
jgi:molybdopterin/thiamine biosynthesis adenylyltransferase